MKNIVDRSTTIGNLYKGTSLEYLGPLLYYGWVRNDPKNANYTIYESGMDIWDTDDIINNLNVLYDMNEKGTYQTLFIDDKKLDVCLMHLMHKNTTKFAIVIAGGGYSSVGQAVEGLGVAMHLYKEKNINVFMLNYSIYPDASGTDFMDDLACAVSYIQNHASELHVVMDDYMVIGFSAGGHLAASWGTKTLGYQKYGLQKPGIIGLGYPVISMYSPDYSRTRFCLIGDNPTPDLLEKFSLEKHVDKDYPKTYLWACDKDHAVDFKINSLSFAKVLEANHIPLIFKVIEGNAHGWGIGKGKPIEGWVDEMYQFYEQK